MQPPSKTLSTYLLVALLIICYTTCIYSETVVAYPPYSLSSGPTSDGVLSPKGLSTNGVMIYRTFQLEFDMATMKNQFNLRTYVMIGESSVPSSCTVPSDMVQGQMNQTGVAGTLHLAYNDTKSQQKDFPPPDYAETFAAVSSIINEGTGTTDLKLTFGSSHLQLEPFDFTKEKESSLHLGIDITLPFLPTAPPNPKLHTINCDLRFAVCDGGNTDDSCENFQISVEFPPLENKSNFSPISPLFDWTAVRAQDVQASSFLERNDYYRNSPQPILSYVVESGVMIHNLPTASSSSTPSAGKCDGIALVTLAPLTPWKMWQDFSTPTKANLTLPMKDMPVPCFINNKEVLQGSFQPYSTLVKHMTDDSESIPAPSPLTFTNDGRSIIITPDDPLLVALYIPLPLQSKLFQLGGSLSVKCPTLRSFAISPFANYGSVNPNSSVLNWTQHRNSLEYKNAMLNKPIKTNVQLYQSCGNGARVAKLHNSIVAESYPTLSPNFPLTIISNASWVAPWNIDTGDDIHVSTTFHFGEGFFHILNEGKTAELDTSDQEKFGYIDHPQLVFTVTNCRLTGGDFENKQKGAIVQRLMADTTTRTSYSYTYKTTENPPQPTPLEFSSSSGQATYNFLADSDAATPRYNVTIDMTNFFQDSRRKTGGYPQLFHFKAILQCTPVDGAIVSVATQVATTKQSLGGFEDPEPKPEPGPKPEPEPEPERLKSGQDALLGQDVPPKSVSVWFNNVSVLSPKREAMRHDKPSTFELIRTTTKPQEGSGVVEEPSNHLNFKFELVQYPDSPPQWDHLFVKFSFLQDSFQFSFHKTDKLCDLTVDGSSTAVAFKVHESAIPGTTGNDITSFFALATPHNWGTIFLLQYQSINSFVQDDGFFSSLYFDIVNPDKHNSTPLPQSIEIVCSSMHATSTWREKKAGLDFKDQSDVLLVSLFVSPTSPDLQNYVADIRRSQINWKPVSRTIAASDMDHTSIDTTLVLFVAALSTPMLLLIGLSIAMWCKLRQVCCFKPHYYVPKAKKSQPKSD